MKWKIFWGVVAGIFGVYILLVLIRIPNAIDKQKEAEAIAKIHATRLTLDDVMGKNLPPDPGAEANKTLAGVDANKNGIRDDVELAIFKQYPNSARVRAALLQYALELQLELTQPIVTRDVVAAVAEDGSRGLDCIDIVFPWKTPQDFDRQKAAVDFVQNLQANNEARNFYINQKFYRFTDVYALKQGCDIDLETLPN